MFTSAIDERGGNAAAQPDAELLFIYRHMAVEVHALRVRPPFWKAISPLFNPVELPPEPLSHQLPVLNHYPQCHFSSSHMHAELAPVWQHLGTIIDLV